MDFRISSVILPLSILLFSCGENRVANNEDTGGQSAYLKVCFEEMPAIGEWQGIRIYEGGFSGLHLVKGTTNEFLLVNDRGPNVPAHKLARSEGRSVKVFPFPDYTQKLVHVKLEDGKFGILSVTPLLTADGQPLSGLPPLSDTPTGHDEPAWSDTSGTETAYTRDGFDIEGIVADGDSIMWLVEEYRPSILKMNRRTGRLLEVISPENGQLPSLLTKRVPNRGFEGVALTPGGTVYAMLQSPMWHPDRESVASSRLVRILGFDRTTGSTSCLVYEMTSPTENIRAKDWKIGDMVAVDDHHLLVLEHGSRKGKFRADVYLVELNTASDVTWDELIGDRSLEQYGDAATLLKETGLKAVRKRHIIDLRAAGLGEEAGKPEGLTIVNDSLIAVVNDNDYGLDSPDEDGTAIATGHPSCIHFFKLPTSIGSIISNQN